MPPIRFKDHTAAELHALLAPLGVSLRLARRLQAVVVRQGADQIPVGLPEVSPRLLERVRQATVLPRLTRVEKAVSDRDGFTR